MDIGNAEVKKEGHEKINATSVNSTKNENLCGCESEMVDLSQQEKIKWWLRTISSPNYKNLKRILMDKGLREERRYKEVYKLILDGDEYISVLIPYRDVGKEEISRAEVFVIYRNGEIFKTIIDWVRKSDTDILLTDNPNEMVIENLNKDIYPEFSIFHNDWETYYISFYYYEGGNIKSIVWPDFINPYNCFKDKYDACLVDCIRNNGIPEYELGDEVELSIFQLCSSRCYTYAKLVCFLFW